MSESTSNPVQDGRNGAALLQPASPRAMATISAIIETAERLWGTHGVEGASLREISIASGSANKSSISYHFGDRLGLIEAIFKVRIPALEERRRPMLVAAEAQGALDDPLTLLRIIFQPVFQDVDSHGRHSFAAFLRAVARFPSWDGMAGARDLSPLAYEAMKLLRIRVGHLPKALFDARLRLVYEICYGAIIDQDDAFHNPGRDTALAEKIFEDALAAATHLILID